MCLIIDCCKHTLNKKTNLFRAHIARKPIIVYKVLSPCYGGWEAPYRFTVYHKQETKKSKLDQFYHAVLGRGEIEAGLHAYKTRAYAFHCRREYHRERVFRMVIPKGARYFIGRYGTIVSNKLYTGSLKPLKKGR